MFGTLHIHENYTLKWIDKASAWFTFAIEQVEIMEVQN